jgi:CheY-like chemotaxis protein
MTKVRLLWVEDSAADRVLYRELLSSGDSNDGWLDGLEIVDVAKPLDAIAGYREFDGIVLDLNLGAVNGLDLASQIHYFDWRIPILVLTGSEPGSIPLDACADVDEIAYKQDALSPDGSFYWAFKKWVRWIARVKESRR